jgi:RHS repeat-associated protein
MSDPYQAPANPSHYRLKLPNGTVYSLTQGVGITQVADTDGNTLTYSPNGIKHSLGQEVKFLRDGQGRIEEIVLPDGRRRHYTYTPAGDLEMSVDAGADITSFAYLAKAPHYLRDILDPRGVRVSRNEYDDDGRLVATIDADNHRIEYTHNLAGRLETIKDRRGNASTYAYDEEGRVTAESNALGETTLHSYDANGNELSTTDPLGHVTRRSFDPRGNVLTETNALGQTITRTYDERNNLLTQTDALGRVVATNGYNAYTGKLVMTQDALGQLTSFGYDSGIGSGGTGELTGVTDAGNQQTRYELNFFGQRFREIDPAGNKTDFVLDSTGRVHGQWKSRTRADGVTEALLTSYTLDDKDRIVATVQADGSRTTVEYDGNGKPLKSCDALTRCTLQEYNARGELAKTTYPDGTFESSLYDENGNVVAHTDRGGRVTKMVYDPANRLVETILPDATPGTDDDNPRAHNKYDAAGRMTASIDERNARTEFGYDAAGRRTSVKDALDHVTTTLYDAAGQREFVTDPLGRKTHFVYDLAGRLTQTIYPDNTAFEDDNPRTSIEYDEAGRKTAEVDELGRRKSYVYDALGRMIAVTLPNPASGQLDAGALVTRFVYDEAGNKTQQIDALGRITRWEYDAVGRQIRRTLPRGQSETFSYDAAGQRRAHTDFNGQTAIYSFNVAGRLEGIDYTNDPDVIITYTPSGQRKTVTDGQGTTTYSYTARDQLRSVQTPDGQAITYAYDATGNRTELHSAALDQSFVYDELNRLRDVNTRALGGPERNSHVEYDGVGNRRLLVGATGTTTATTYDERNRLVQLVTRSAAGAVIFGATYTVDDSGLRTGIAEWNDNGVVRSVGYAYDGAKRLIAEVIERTGQPARVTNYVYDEVGNRLSKSEAGALTSYTVDGNDRLTEETKAGASTIYTYDANGNLTSEAKLGDLLTFGYDESNRRIRATKAGVVVETGYNADGIRNRESSNGQVTSWVIDSNRGYAQTLEAYSGNQLRTIWIYGDTLLAQTNVVAGRLVELELHTDAMGSVRQVSDSSGAISDSFEYDAYGVELAHMGSSEIDHRYRGEQLDSLTGLYNLRSRWYEAGTGRFASMDSFAGDGADPITLHRYLYSNADPVNWVDPSGKFGLSELSVSMGVAASLATTATPRLIGEWTSMTEQEKYLLHLSKFQRNERIASGVSVTGNTTSASVNISVKYTLAGSEQDTGYARLASFVPNVTGIWNRSGMRSPSGHSFGINVALTQATWWEDLWGDGVIHVANGVPADCNDRRGVTGGDSEIRLCPMVDKGTDAHEFGHILGFGDMYGTIFDDQDNPFFDTAAGEVMGNDTSRPRNVHWYHAAILAKEYGQ